jgi:hypothetical protein
MIDTDSHEAGAISELLKIQKMDDLNRLSNEPISETEVPPFEGPKLGKISNKSATGTYKYLKVSRNLVAPI